MRFSWENHEKLSLECRNLFSKSQNEKPLIWKSIGSFIFKFRIVGSWISYLFLIFSLFAKQFFDLDFAPWFLPNIYSYNIIFKFRIVGSWISYLFLIFSLFANNFSILTLLLDFSTNTDLNRVIFYSVDSSSSSLSKFFISIHGPIWSNFEEYLKITLILCGFDPNSPLYSSIRDYNIKLWV